jgi:ketosteroid isomerase-like protein
MLTYTLSAVLLALSLAGSAFAQPPRNLAPETAAAANSSAAAEVIEFEKNLEAAVVRGDVAFVDKVLTDDFTFVHGDGWTTGGKPLRVDNKASFLALVEKKTYSQRDLGSMKVELHGDIAITYGMYRARMKAADPKLSEFTVWFERVYAKRNGQWQYLSHRTVHGPVFGSGD